MRRATAAPTVQVYSGRDAVGTVEQVAGGYVARDIRGRALGKLPTRAEAMRMAVQAAKEAS